MNTRVNAAALSREKAPLAGDVASPHGPPVLVFAHGWGFDASFWDALRTRLPAWPQRVLERGYFAGLEQDDALPDGPWVMIGHSFGFLRMLDWFASAPAGRPCAWIGINGFARFGGGRDFRQGVAPRVLQRMAARLDDAPAAVVNKFRARCGAAPGAVPFPQRLAHDLRAMQVLDRRDFLHDFPAPLLILAGTDDPVVDAHMTGEALPGCDIDWMPGGGHLLPCQSPQWCAERITGFLTRHGLAPEARSGTPVRDARDEDPPEARACRVDLRFGAAAARYDRHAGVQLDVATRLKARIAALDLPARPRILEVGCGTGMLTRMLAEQFPEADWTITDLSPAMVDHARRRLRLGGVSRYQVMDGEAPAPQDDIGSFDLICSSMALQWFGDPAQGLARLASLLTPAGYLAVAVPVQGTFVEWRRAHETLGVRPGTLRFPSTAALRQPCAGLKVHLEVESIVDECGSALDFLRNLKCIGATAPQPGTRPLSVAQLRRVCGEFDRAGARCSYRIAFGLWRRDGVVIKDHAVPEARGMTEADGMLEGRGMRGAGAVMNAGTFS
ncbi:MAG: methyltransferase [Castellaniella sp.]|uniref:methyltransferase n=1 Tax=Castellaniella sp. TaxID=1955812 RepID=UPI003A864589